MIKKVQFSLLAPGSKFYLDSIEYLKLQTSSEVFNCVEISQGKLEFFYSDQMVLVDKITLFLPSLEK